MKRTNEIPRADADAWLREHGLRRGGPAPAKRTKWGNVRTLADCGLIGELSCDSKKEAVYAQNLALLWRDGQIKFFLFHVPIRLPGRTTYECDFVVFENDGRVRFIDVKGGSRKGTRTENYLLKKRQVQAIYGIQVEEA